MTVVEEESGLVESESLEDQRRKALWSERVNMRLDQALSRIG